MTLEQKLDNLKTLYVKCGGGKSRNELPFLAKLRIKIAKLEEIIFPYYK
jgi:hypothetical protein